MKPADRGQSQSSTDVEPGHPSDAEGPRRNPRPLAAAAAAAGPPGDRRMPVHHGRRRLLRVGRRRLQLQRSGQRCRIRRSGWASSVAPVFSGTQHVEQARRARARLGTSTRARTGTSSTAAPQHLGTSSSSTSGTTRRERPSFRFPFPLNLVNTGNWPSKGTIVGMDSPTTFSQDLNVPFRQGSFESVFRNSVDSTRTPV